MDMNISLALRALFDCHIVAERFSKTVLSDFPFSERVAARNETVPHLLTSRGRNEFSRWSRALGVPGML